MSRAYGTYSEPKSAAESARPAPRPHTPNESSVWSGSGVGMEWRREGGRREEKVTPRKDKKPVAQARAMETLRDALLVAEVSDHRDVLHTIT